MTFTPLIGLTALETFTGTQLANFKELEAAYSTYWKASTSAADKKAELQNTISKNTQIADGLRKKQADVLVQQQASLAEFNVLASQRSTANETLGRASQAFKDAVNILRNSQPSFLELLSCIASTVVGVGADVAGIGKITGDWKSNFDLCTHGNPTPCRPYESKFKQAPGNCCIRTISFLRYLYGTHALYGDNPISIVRLGGRREGHP